MFLVSSFKNIIFSTKAWKKHVARKKIYNLVDKYMLTPSEISQGESDPKAMEKLVERQMKKWPKRAKEQSDRIDWLISSPLYKGNTDIGALRTKMLFYYFAYGFTPSEYLAYDLKDKSPEERIEYMSDRESVKYAYRLNDNDSVNLFMDKRKTYEALKKYYRREAIAITCEDDYEKFCEFVKKHPVFVKKDARESCGRGIELVDTRSIQAGI